MEDTAQSQSQANTMVMTLTVQVFPKMSSNHTVQKHTGVANFSHKCRFARHLHTLLPTLGESSGSRGQRLLDALSGCETRACPPSKKCSGKVPAAVAKTQRLHACDLVTI